MADSGWQGRGALAAWEPRGSPRSPGAAGVGKRRDTGRAMSQENVDALRGCLEAATRGDLPGLLRFMDPEIRFECQLAPVQGIYAGHDGVRDFFADFTEVFEPVRMHCPDV